MFWHFYLYRKLYLIFSQVNQYDYSKSIIHCHPQEFCVGAIGDKIIVKACF